MKRTLVGLAWAAILASGAAADDLDQLATVRDAVSRRVSSAAPEPWSNRDNRRIAPGETFTLASIKGPGVIRHLWLTFAESSPSWLSNVGSADPSEIVLRMYWDGATEPAVEAPLGDFFAAGFGQRAEVRSLPVQVQGGDSYNCYWPMPFLRDARITVTNESTRPLVALYYQIDYTEEPSLPPDSAHFCAQYRQEFPTVVGRPYLIADIEGTGQYVGTVLSVRARSPQWFGEGDDLFVVDGQGTSDQPTMRGTGTEDYVSNAWGMELGCFPYFGVTILDGNLDQVGSRGTMYRWHLPDAVRFRSSLRVEIEHAGWMSADETTTGKIEGFVEREDDFATVAFWYQRGQPKRFATLPSPKERKLPSLDRVIEGKDLLSKATGSKASLSLQAGAPWTGDGQLFVDGRLGSAVDLLFTVGDEGPSLVVLPLTHSYDFGTYRISLDGQAIGDPLDCYSPTVKVEELVLSPTALAPGEHRLRLECVGVNERSKGGKLGVDSIRIRRRSDHKRAPLGPPPAAAGQPS